MNLVLAVNSGSSSTKVAAFDGDRALARVRVGGIGGTAEIALERGDQVTRRPLGLIDHDVALTEAIRTLESEVALGHCSAIGHRFAHGGPRFFDPVLLSGELLAELERQVPLAPLHLPHNLAGVRTIERIMPGTPQVACFDTAFHRTLPATERHYALPRELTEAGIVAYGFHGLSFEYIASILPRHLDRHQLERVVVAHLGSGASLCAMRNLRSVATTMGFSPLDGLVMATRSGSIDPGVLLHLMETRGMDARQLNDLLYRRSGLLGISGFSGDVKELLASPAPAAGEALALFVARVAKSIGAMAAVLRGVDALVFTGGIGEHAALLREQIVERCDWLGFELDTGRNKTGATRISPAGATHAVLVLPTDEERVVADGAASLTKKRSVARSSEALGSASGSAG